MKRPLSTREAASVLRVSLNTVRARAEDGTLTAYRELAPEGRKRRGNLVFEWTSVAAAAQSKGLHPVHPDDAD